MRRMGMSQISRAARNIMGKSFFQRLRCISQLGEPLNFLFLGKLPSFTVFDHTWLFYEFANYFSRKENFDLDDIETLRVAALVHDLVKPPWTPLSETFMVKSHEELLTEFVELKNEKDVRWDHVYNAVQGQGKFANCFEGEGDFDKLSYIALANELLSITSGEPTTDLEYRFGVKEAYRLISFYRFVSHNGRNYLALEPNPIAFRLFSMFLKALVEHYKLFLSPYVAICEGLGFRILEDAIESGQLDVRLFSDVNFIVRTCDRDIDLALYNLKPVNDAAKHAKNLWKVITSRRFARFSCFEVPYSEVLSDFIRKLRIFRAAKSVYMNSEFRSLLKNVEAWVANNVGAPKYEERDFILMSYERIKPDFVTTYNIEDWDWCIKLKINGLDLVSKRGDIRKIKEQEKKQLNRLVLIFPSKYLKKIREIPWDEIPVEI